MRFLWVAVLASWCCMVESAFAQPSLPSRPPGAPSPVPEYVAPERVPPPPRIPATPDELKPTRIPPADRPLQLFEFRWAVGGAEEYTDNFRRSHSGAEANYRSTLSPSASLKLNTGPVFGQLRYAPSVFHDTIVSSISHSHLASLDLAWDVTPTLKLTVTDTFTRSDEPERSDLLGLQQQRRQFTRNSAVLGAEYAIGLVAVEPYYRLVDFDAGEQTTKSQTAGASATVELARINKATVGYDYLSSDTATGPSSASTISGHGLTASLSRDISTAATIGLTTSYAWRTQEQTGTRAASGTTSDFSQFQGGVFTTYSIPNVWVLRSAIGVARLDRDGSAGKPVLTTLTGTTVWFGRVVARLDASKGYSETFVATANAGVMDTTSASASLTYPFTPLLSGRISATWRDNKSTGAGGSAENREEKTLTGLTGLTLRLLGNVDATLDYARTQFSPSGVDQSYTENRFRLSLQARF